MDNLLNRITIDKNVCNGKPSIGRMRFTVSQMIELVASGMTNEEILIDYPYIEADDIAACLQYQQSDAVYKRDSVGKFGANARRRTDQSSHTTIKSGCTAKCRLKRKVGTMPSF